MNLLKLDFKRKYMDLGSVLRSGCTIVFLIYMIRFSYELCLSIVCCQQKAPALDPVKKCLSSNGITGTRPILLKAQH